MNECKERYKQYHLLQEYKDEIEKAVDKLKGERSQDPLAPVTPEQMGFIQEAVGKKLMKQEYEEHKRFRGIDSGKNPHKCPVCDGKGFVFVELMAGMQKIADNKACHRCSGKGWLIC